MGLGFSLIAKPLNIPNEELLDRVERWVREHLASAEHISRSDLVVSVTLHPTAEAVELSLCGPGTLSVSAKTSTTGPGYHAYLVETIEELARGVGLEWRPIDEDGESGDETGYFQSKDYDALEQEMLGWLRSFAEWLVEHSGTELDVCMPIDRHYLLPGDTRTPLGPRDLEYWKRVAEDPQQGTDFFAWWEKGHGAGYHLGVALALLWSDVRWREPYNDEEERVLRRVAESLRAAYEIDPSRAYPWREWEEVLDLLGDTCEVPFPSPCSMPESEPIGYRRDRVRLTLAGGWQLTLPGDFTEEWQDGTLHAWCESRTVWLSAFRGPQKETLSEEELKAEPSEPGEEILERREPGLYGLARLTRAVEDEEPYWQLSTKTLVGDRLALVTICYGDDGDRAWAIETWHSLRLPKQKED